MTVRNYIKRCEMANICPLGLPSTLADCLTVTWGGGEGGGAELRTKDQPSSRAFKFQQCVGNVPRQFLYLPKLPWKPESVRLKIPSQMSDESTRLYEQRTGTIIDAGDVTESMPFKFGALLLRLG